MFDETQLVPIYFIQCANTGCFKLTNHCIITVFKNTFTFFIVLQIIQPQSKFLTAAAPAYKLLNNWATVSPFLLYTYTAG